MELPSEGADSVRIGCLPSLREGIVAWIPQPSLREETESFDEAIQ